MQNAVQRALRENLNDPATGLPAGRVTREELEAARGRPGRAILEFRLRNLAPFRDQYGLLAGTDLVRYTALLLNRLLNQLGAAEDFLGWQADEAFVVVCAADKAEVFQRTAVERFRHDAVQHYTLGERLGADQVRVRLPDGQPAVLPIVQLEARRAQ